MWKIALGFIIFAALGLWLLSKGGNVDIGGEKHSVEAPTEVAASAPAVPASGASN